MKNILLTISISALLLAGQSAMALNEDSSGYELLTGNVSQLELPVASYRSDDITLEFSGSNENDTGMVTPASTFDSNHASPLGFSGGNEN